MLIELIAVVVAGVAAGGVAALARRAVPALARWLVPVAAGGGMLLAAVALEYGWYGRTADALPEGVEVAMVRENREPWRPWTYVVPYVDGFIAVDRRSTLTHPEAPDRRIVDLVVFGRWVPPVLKRAVFDCAGGRRADLTGGVSFAEDGDIEGANWHDTGPDDPVTRTACAGA